jgi:hypothetical protein
MCELSLDKEQIEWLLDSIIYTYHFLDDDPLRSRSNNAVNTSEKSPSPSRHLSLFFRYVSTEIMNGFII